jgi:ABC-2 type transport system ATP-binding protein
MKLEQELQIADARSDERVGEFNRTRNSKMAPLAIEVTGLKKSFGDVQAVRGLDLQVRRGEVFGLLGPNGAGKTTTLEMLEGLVKPDGGEIRLLGMDWRSQGKTIRNRIGVQFQNTLYDDNITVREALEMYSKYYAHPRPIDELLQSLQLEEIAHAYQSKLSGGQRQRLALGLALVNDPELVFLDEPTTGLDPQARRSFWDLVCTMKSEGRTVLITTHYMDEAEALCDRIGIMDHGRILQIGSSRELITSLNQPSYAELEFLGTAPDASEFTKQSGMPVERHETRSAADSGLRRIAHSSHAAGARAPAQSRRCVPASYRSQPT